MTPLLHTAQGSLGCQSLWLAACGRDKLGTGALAGSGQAARCSSPVMQHRGGVTAVHAPFGVLPNSPGEHTIGQHAGDGSGGMLCAMPFPCHRAYQV